jgi:alpha-L-arabinofuranosidase
MHTRIAHGSAFEQVVLKSQPLSTMKNHALLCALAGGLMVGGLPASADPLTAHAIIHPDSSSVGRIDPKLFGNFIELLDDVVPGMWAELLNDRSFEGVIPAADWSYYDGTPDICDRQWDTNATWTIDTKDPFNGGRCARLTAGAQPASLTQTGLTIKKGMAYAFSGYLRTDRRVKTKVVLKCLLPTGEWMRLASADLPALSGRWQKVSVRMRSQGQTDHAVFELIAQGTGNLWADKLSLMPGDNLSGWRRDVVEVVREVRPGVIRWGGSTVDPGHYLWKIGIGDRDLRMPWRNEVWGRIDSNDVGIDEFCQFCELTASEPLICVSFGDGPRSAADLVEYCNGGTDTAWGAKRAGHGHPAPYRVKYWQVGNEVDGADPKYLDQLAGFIAAMKKADPQISILTSFPSQPLLERVGKDIAFVCPHHYIPDLAACDRQFNEIARMIDQLPGCGHVKVGVTEWNIDAGAWGLGRAQMATLGGALMNARYLHVMMRHSDKVELACRSNLANSYCGAIIETGTGGSGVLKRPSFYVMKLYARHAKPIPLRLDQNGEDLDLFACASADRRTMVIFAVNSKPQAIEFSFEFNGRPVGGLKAEALCDSRGAGQPDIMNHWQAPERVKIVPVPTTGNRIILPPLSAAAIEWEGD